MKKKEIHSSRTEKLSGLCVFGSERRTKAKLRSEAELPFGPSHSGSEERRLLISEPRVL
jgi:hypothetical protein